MKETYVNDRQIAERFGICRATVWNWARAGILPKPKKIGPNVTRWVLAEVEQHMTERGVA